MSSFPASINFRHPVSGFFLPVLLGLLAQGCIRFDHSLIDQPKEPLQTLAERSCCDSLEGLEIPTLPANKYVTLLVDESDPVLQFTGGKSFTKVVQLPPIEGGYLLQLDSVVYIPRADLFPEALYPMVTLLDADLETVAVYDQEQVNLLKPIFGPDLLRIIVDIKAGSTARYAMIYTSESRTRQGMSKYSPYQIVDKDNFDTILYSRPTHSRHKIHFSETGMVTLLAYRKPQ